MHNTPARVYIITQVRWTMRAAAPFRFNARARAHLQVQRAVACRTQAIVL